MPEDQPVPPAVAPAALRHWTRGGARPVLALHCSLAHAGAWAGLAERLQGVTVTAPDLPGHGAAAEWDGKADLHDLSTRMVAALARELAGDAAIDLFGHSFGATVALRLALEGRVRLRSLVLIEPVLFAAARGHAAFDRFGAGQEAMTRALDRDPAEGAALFHAAWGAGEPLDQLPERQRRYIIDRIPLIPAQNPALMADAAGLLRPGRLEALAVSVLLLEGAESPEIIAAVHDRLAARLPRVVRRVVPGAGHMLPITHADAVARAVLAHLAAR